MAVNGNDTGLTRVSSIHGIILNATDTSKYVIFGETVITNPHDVAISPDLQEIIVVELGPNKIWKFSTGIQVVEESKPTGLTQESSSGSMKSLIHNYSPVSAFTLLLFAFPVVLIYLCLMYLRRRRRLHTEPTTSLGLRGNRFDRSENTMGYRKLATNDALEEHFHLDTDSDDDEMFNRMTSSKT